jgi:protein-S-isoprenylcysteine O-methyltransferase Ste14
MPVIIFVFLVIIIIAFVDFFIHPRAANIPLLSIGVFLAVVGMIIRLAAQANLGKNFSYEAVIYTDHELVKTGIHKYIRHPMYTGLFLLVVGLLMAMQSYIGLIVAIATLIPLGIYRISVEEKLLKKRFGEEYAEYAKSTKRLVPFVF